MENKVDMPTIEKHHKPTVSAEGYEDIIVIFTHSRPIKLPGNDRPAMRAENALLVKSYEAVILSLQAYNTR